MITLSSSDWDIDGIETVFFDKDGTLIDSHLYWGRIIEMRSQALISMLNLKHDFHEKLCRVLGFSLETKRLLPEGPIALVSRQKVIEILIDFLSQQGFSVSKEQIEKLFVDVHSSFIREIYEYIAILPGVEMFLKQLRSKDVKMAVITSDSIKNTEEIMRFLGIAKYFDLLLGKEEDQNILQFLKSA